MKFSWRRLRLPQNRRNRYVWPGGACRIGSLCRRSQYRHAQGCNCGSSITILLVERRRMMGRLCSKCTRQLANPPQEISLGSSRSRWRRSRYQHAQGYSKKLLKVSWNRVCAKDCLVQSPAGDNPLDAGAGAKESARLPGAGTPNSASGRISAALP